MYQPRGEKKKKHFGLNVSRPLQSSFLIYLFMFKIHVPFELKCPKREKKNEVVLCDDGREKKKKALS